MATEATRILLGDAEATIADLLSEMHTINGTGDMVCDHANDVCFCPWWSAQHRALKFQVKLGNIIKDLGQDLDRTVSYP